MNDLSNSLQLKRRTLLGWGLSAAALAGLSACGASGSSGGGQVPPSQRVKLPAYVPFDKAKPDFAGSNGATDAFLHYPANPPKTIEGKPGDGKPITASSAYFLALPPGIGENAAWQHLNSELGSDLDLRPTPAADYPARFATQVAGNDLPAVMELANAARLPDLLKARFIDLTEHLSGDAVKKYPNLANIPTTAWQASVFNNGIYGIPSVRGLWQTNLVFQRRDLLEAKGVDAGQIGNFDDLLSLAKQVTDSRRSVWALASVPLPYLRGMLNVPNVWKLDNGKLTHAYEVPEQEEALNAAIKLWQAGVVHPDAFANTTTQAKQLFGSGRALLTSDTYPAWFQFHREQTVGDSFDIGGLPLPGYSGGKGGLIIGAPAYAVAGITKGNEDRIETILKVWNYLTAPFGSAEYLSVIYGKSGADYDLKGTDPVLNQRGLRETLSLVTLLSAPRVGYWPNKPEVAKDFYEHMNALAPQAVANPALYRYSATLSQKGPALGERADSTFADIIQGRKKVSDWAGAVTTWRKGGGDRIRGELEEAIAAG